MAEIKFEKDIRIAPEVAVAFPCIVGNAGVTADENGEKWILAGTPIGGSVKFLENRQTVLTVSSTNVQGVILHDTRVDGGNANATILVEGYVDLLKVEDSVNALLTTEVKNQLNKVVFMKGHK